MLVTRLVPASTTHAPGVPVIEPLTGERLSRLAVIDGLRAAACLLVIASHSVTLTGYEPSDSFRTWLVGQAGVVLFFVISGYLVAGPFVRALVEARPLPPPGAYLLRRGSRIIPAWWLALGIAVAALPLLGQPLPSVSLILAHLGLVFAYDPAFRAASPLGVGWTLCFEASFYLALPVLTYAFRKVHPVTPSVDKLAAILAGLWVGGLCDGLLVDASGSHGPLRGNAAASTVLFPGRFFALFIPGILVFLLTLHAAGGSAMTSAFARLRSRRWLLLTVSTLALASAVALRQSKHGTVAGLAYPALSIGMGCVLALMVTRPAGPSRTIRMLARLGLLTYGLYLYHATIVILLLHYHMTYGVLGATVLDALLAWIAPLVLVGLLTLPLGVASWLFIERPLIRWAASVSASLSLKHTAENPS